MICRICGNSDIVKGKAGKAICQVCKYFFGSDNISKQCSKCGQTFLTILAVENTVLPIILKTNSNISTYWRKTQCPTCIVQSIRQAYQQKYGKDWNTPPLDWWGKSEKATVAILINDFHRRSLITKYELESSKIPPKFIDFSLEEHK